MRDQIDVWLHADYQTEKKRNEYYQADGRKIKSFREQPLVNHFILLTNLIVVTLCTLTGDLLYNYGT